MSGAEEIWKPVPGFVGLYEVSDLGRVRSLPRQTATGVLGGRMLKPLPEKNGYVRVTFSADGVAHRHLLHRLVLLAFVGECPAFHECRHGDGVRANCSLTNLCWGTRSDNAKDRIRHGTHVNNRGERHGMTQLSNEDAISIFAKRRGGASLREIADDFSVSISTVCQISRGKSWKFLELAA